MGLCRVVLLLANLPELGLVEHKFAWTAHAFLIGLWFDNVVACYLSLPALLAATLCPLWKKAQGAFFRVLPAYYLLCYALVLFIGIANVPYFSYFFKPINASIFGWNAELGTNSAMVLGEPVYLGYLALFFVFLAAFGWLSRRIGRLWKQKGTLRPERKAGLLLHLPACLLLLLLCLLGIRGRLGYNPIRTSQAYFCDNAFINQLGLNPAFFLIRDLYDMSKSYYTPDKLIGLDKALPLVRKELGVAADAPSPVVREVPAGKVEKKNIVIVLMESMSADFLSMKAADGSPLTPCLDSLVRKSYYFPNFFSAGNHTNHGILATLYGLPSLFNKNMMQRANVPLCEGLPDLLESAGYQTMFFVPHAGQYDNIEAFVKENGIRRLYDESDYPTSERVNAWGVPDAYLFKFAEGELAKANRRGQPFFATILTVSNHPPYIIPEAYRKVSPAPWKQIVAYADAAVGSFVRAASREAWGKNTLFVFLGDHGTITGPQTLDMPLSYNHIPLIIYSPSFTDAPKVFPQYGGQVDVFPTLAGLLGLPYENNTLGVDLLHRRRPYMFFSSDEAFACIDSTYFYCYNMKTRREHLYLYRESGQPDSLAAFRPKADSMRAYAAAMLRTSEYLFKKELTRLQANHDKLR
ncbi:MAG: LTA synthase family protein [Tannerella sp.]|nr:LTA synthase family protein [Tannerella sp.]